jgi:PAS domain S-box-containing protein
VGNHVPDDDDLGPASDDCALLRALVDKLPSMVAYWDNTLRCRFANEAYTRWFGVSPASLRGKHISELLGGLYALNLPYIEGALRGEPQEFEREIPDPSGGPTRHSLANYIPDVVGGVVRGFVVLVTDISDVKRAQMALHQSQERFELALEGADVASWDWNIATGEVVFNRRWAELRGLDLTEVEPHVRSWLSGIHPDDLAPVQKALDDYFDGRTPTYQTEHRVRTKSGEWRWILDRGKVFSRSDTGRPMRMAGIELDVTERKRIEAEQRFLAEVGPVLAGSLDYEETLSTIAELCVRELADLCIVDIVADAKEVRRLKVASRDPSKADLCEVLTRIPLDRSRPHLFGDVLEMKEPFVLPAPSDHVIRSLAQGEEHLRALRAAEIRSLMVVPLVARDTLLGAIAFISSTSSRTYGDADLRLARELAQRASLSIDNARLYRAAQRATRARDEILGVVAHDLRNPLSAIVLQAGLLRRQNEPERRSQRPAEAIERAARRMERLIRDLLDVTSIEAGKLSVIPTRAPAKQILAECIESQRALASSSSLDLRLDVPPELPDVRADRDRLLQALENLLANALKFTKPGGRVTVGARRRANDVLFSVRDTGAGIPPEHLPHVFDRFWQHERGSRRGAGLGLPIVKGIVEAHGGRVWVESTPDQGTSFFFTIPVEEGGA